VFYSPPELPRSFRLRGAYLLSLSAGARVALGKNFAIFPDHQKANMLMPKDQQ
tara:strand:+ start:491 stop:649 length:159 start_codon:yes stop_codon:yes gene_type:complete